MLSVDVVCPVTLVQVTGVGVYRRALSAREKGTWPPAARVLLECDDLVMTCP